MCVNFIHAASIKLLYLKYGTRKLLYIQKKSMVSPSLEETNFISRGVARACLLKPQFNTYFLKTLKHFVLGKYAFLELCTAEDEIEKNRLGPIQYLHGSKRGMIRRGNVLLFSLNLFLCHTLLGLLSEFGYDPPRWPSGLVSWPRLPVTNLEAGVLPPI